MQFNRDGEPFEFSTAGIQMSCTASEVEVHLEEKAAPTFALKQHIQDCSSFLNLTRKLRESQNK